MKQVWLGIICCMIVGTVNAQSFDWVRGGGGTEDLSSGGSISWEQVKYMCTDKNGNIYALSLVGNGTIIADTFHAYLHGAAPNNLLVTSYNCEGQLRWGKFIATTATGCSAFGIAADTTGHIYVSGLFPTPTFHIGSDTAITSYLYQTDGVIQLDTNGHYKWIRFTGNNSLATSNGFPVGKGLAMDKFNNIHDFEYMGIGVPLMPGDTSIYGVYDMTYNSAGTLLSAVRLDLDSEWFLNGAVIDPATGKLYVSGEVNQSFGYGSAGVDTFFAAAFDASRNRLWMYFPGYSSNDYISNVILDQSKHLHYNCGANLTIFSYNRDTVLNTHFLGYATSLIMTTDTNGTPLKIEKFDGSTVVIGYNQITQLPDNKVAGAGAFAGTLIDDYGHSITTPPGVQNPFLVVVDSASDLEIVQEIYGDGFYNWGTAITSDKVGNVYIGGYVTDSIWAVNGTSSITAYKSVGGNTDFFVMKYGVDCGCTTMPVAHYSYTVIGGTVSFTYRGTSAGSGIDSVVWNYGDPVYSVTGGGHGVGLTSTHTYTASGSYHACVTVYTSCGRDLFCNDVSVCLPPVGGFSSTSYRGGDSIRVAYTGSTYSMDSVVWALGDGSRDTGITAHHTYSATGVYSVCETAYTGCGNDTACRYDTVLCVTPPVASYSVTNNMTLTKHFTYTGTLIGVDSVVWHFAPGHGTGDTITHTYIDTGAYRVCVYAYNPCGEDSSCMTVHVDSSLQTSPSPLQRGNISVSPNPVTETLIIRLPNAFGTGICEIVVCDILGKEVYHGSMSGSEQVIDVSKWASGVYVLTLTPQHTPNPSQEGNSGEGDRIIMRVVKE